MRNMQPVEPVRNFDEVQVEATLKFLSAKWTMTFKRKKGLDLEHEWIFIDAVVAGLYRNGFDVKVIVTNFGKEVIEHDGQDA